MYLEEKGITIEEHFYLDYSLAEGGILRIFSKREDIDLVQVDSGRVPKKTVIFSWRGVSARNTKFLPVIR